MIYDSWDERNLGGISAIAEAEKEYIDNPNNESLRKLLIATAKNCFVTEKSLMDGKKLFKRIPVNHSASEQVLKNFDSEKYQASCVPQKISTLIMAGANDHITPLHLFKKNKIYQKKIYY